MTLLVLGVGVTFGVVFCRGARSGIDPAFDRIGAFVSGV